MVFIKSVISGLTSIIAIVLGTVNQQFPIFPSPWNQFSETWEFLSWLQSGQPVFNLSTRWRFQCLYDSSQDMTQKSIHSPWGGNTGPCLCFMTTLLLFHLLCLFSFGIRHSQFSDSRYSLTKIFHRQKAGWNSRAGARNIRSYTASIGLVCFWKFQIIPHPFISWEFMKTPGM